MDWGEFERRMEETQKRWKKGNENVSSKFGGVVFCRTK